jgi:glycosyltransferase involved in cell wall biosynthesis
MTLYRILRDFDPSGYRLLSIGAGQEETGVGNIAVRLDAPVHRIPSRWGRRLASARILWRVALPFLWADTRQRAGWIASLLRRERSELLVACTGDPIDLPAGWMAARKVGIPFIAAIYDHYTARNMNWNLALFARVFERRIVRDAAGIWVLNEVMRDVYQKAYGVEPSVVRNPCIVSPDRRAVGDDWPASPGEIRIVYTGAVYHVHYDAFQKLLDGMRRLNRPDLRLHIYTAQPAAQLARMGIEGPVEIHPHVSERESIELQNRADILYLPLGFETGVPLVVNTSAPFKTGEYLACGRPILAHAPKGSFVASYFREHECGFVVDDPDAGEVARVLRRILEDSPARKKAGANAIECARRHFDLPVCRRDFIQLLEKSCARWREKTS